VDDHPDTQKLNAIVGAAIRSLVESGAEDAFIGQFAHSHRAKVAGILGLEGSPVAAPDLLALVTQAVANALEQSGVGRKRVSQTQRVNVEVGGKRTSVTISRSLVDQLTKMRGSKQEAKAVIQELASSAPSATPNRSGFVEQRIQAVLALASSGDAGVVRH
jgi:hypothetical protein